MKRKGFGRLILFLIEVMSICLCMSYIPEHIWGVTIKPIDMLSELRADKKNLAIDSLQTVLRQDTIVEKIIVHIEEEIDTTNLHLRDSIFKAMYSNIPNIDSTGSSIEDNSLGRIGLKRFFEAVNNRETLGRPVRVAFLGDSFIEGDIIVASVRNKLQSMYGGRGVGFVPITTPSAKFRPTTSQEAEGWKSFNILTDKGKRSFTLPGLSFTPEEENSRFYMKMMDKFNKDDSVSSVKLYYERNLGSLVRIVTDQKDTTYNRLYMGESIQCLEKKVETGEAEFIFSDIDSLQVLGVAMEDNHGIVVDNFSLRGSPGYILSNMDSTKCQEFNNVRPYDLLVLQYGLNVVTDSILDYRWYGSRMTSMINRLKTLYPKTDILMLGVSDRGQTENGEVRTMPAVLAMLHTQRRVAQKTGIPFWNTFGAMGGENSIVAYAEKNWASKDFTHISYRGGHELAKRFIEALMKEKQFNDETEKNEK